MCRLFILLILLAAMLPGCGSPSANGPVLSNQQVKRQWDLIREDPLEGLPQPPVIPGNQTRGALRVRELELPLGPAASPLFDQAEAGAISPLVQHLWRENGVRLAVVPVAALDSPEVSDALDREVLAVRTQRVIATDLATPLRRSPALGGVVEVDLTAPPRTRRLVRLSGGTLQLLVRLPAADSRVIELVPQHHRPRASVLPRAPWEKELEGEAFEELAFRLALPPGRALVIAMEHDWPGVEEDSDGEDETGDERAEPATPGDVATPPTLGSSPASSRRSTRAEVQPPRVSRDPREVYAQIPPHLGHALLIADHLGTPAQIVLVIATE